MSGYEEDDNDASDSSESDLGVIDATNAHESKASVHNTDSTELGGNIEAKGSVNDQDKKDLHRKQRGLMQWKPMRNLAFVRDEAKFAVRRTLKKGSLTGRELDVETET